MNISIAQPKDIVVKVDNLDDFISSKYLFKMNTENMRRELLQDIENWFMQKIDRWAWERDSSYKKDVLDQIEKTKLHYYTVLVNQSGLDAETQRNMILKYKTDRDESEWEKLLNLN